VPLVSVESWSSEAHQSDWIVEGRAGRTNIGNVAAPGEAVAVFNPTERIRNTTAEDT
jgi:hypothetical protein